MNIVSIEKFTRVLLLRRKGIVVTRMCRLEADFVSFQSDFNSPML